MFLELDVKCEACQRFFKEGLTTSFMKILTDEAVSGWKMEIHVSIKQRTVAYDTRCSSFCACYEWHQLRYYRGNGDALNVEHRSVCGDGDRLHGSTAGALFAVTLW